MTTVAAYPGEVAPLVDALFAGVREALGENFVGFYLRGSLALGGFNPETSDVDVLVVTEHPVSESEFAALDALHLRINARDNMFGRHYEASYVDRVSLRRFSPGERRHPTVGADWAFGWGDYRDNFIMERWMVREHGVVLAGPDPKTLIDPISPDDLRDAARKELLIRVEDWAREWNDGENPAPWLDTRYYQAFEIETVCRALYTVEFGELPTKPQAVDWALEALPDEWRPLVQWSRDHHSDKTPDLTMISEIIRFVQWAAAEYGR
jgi:predicted nucleotidyltransferase